MGLHNVQDAVMLKESVKNIRSDIMVNEKNISRKNLEAKDHLIDYLRMNHPTILNRWEREFERYKNG